MVEDDACAVRGSGFLTDNDPKPTVELIKKTLKIYPYTPGGFGTSIATALEGKVRLEVSQPVPATKFVEASGKSFNTIPPSDYSFFEMINANIQQEPADFYNPELAGQLAAIGIVRENHLTQTRMRKIPTDAAAVGNAAGRVLNWRPREFLGWSYYPGSSWANMLWQGGANFETPPPMITKEGFFKPLPPTGARTLDLKTAFYYGYTLDSPGMIMRLPRVGSQYLMGFLDGDKRDLDGAKTYKVTLPPNIPAAAFWSFTLYDNQTRSMLDTPQRYPRAGSQSFRRPPPNRAPTVPRRSTSARPSRLGSSVETGYKPCPARVGSRSFASIARSNLSSRRTGGRARSNWSSNESGAHDTKLQQILHRPPAVDRPRLFRCENLMGWRSQRHRRDTNRVPPRRLSAIPWRLSF